MLPYGKPRQNLENDAKHGERDEQSAFSIRYMTLSALFKS